MKQRKRKPAHPRANPAKQRRTRTAKNEPAPDITKVLIEFFVMAERGGVLRAVLQGAMDSFRKRKEDQLEWSSPIAKRVREQRQAVEAYVYSILQPLDARTKAGVMQHLLDDLWGDAEGWEMAGREPNVEERGRAEMGILGAMRTVATAYCSLAKKQGGALAEEMALYAAQIVEVLNEIAQTNPAWVEPLASEMIAWPVMMSRHHPKHSDFQKLADRIGLGAKSPVKPQKRHTWKPTTPLNRYLLKMLVVENWGNGLPLTRDAVPHYLDKVLMPLFDDVAKESGGWENYPEFAAIAHSAAKRGKKGVQRSEIRNRVKDALEAFASQAGD